MVVSLRGIPRCALGCNLAKVQSPNHLKMGLRTIRL